MNRSSPIGERSIAAGEHCHIFLSRYKLKAVPDVRNIYSELCEGRKYFEMEITAP
jgi:hypothetical protein